MRRSGVTAILFAFDKLVRAAAISVSLCVGGSLAVADAQQPAPAPRTILTAATPAAAQPAKPAVKKKPRPKADAVPQIMSDVAGWITSSGDSRGLPFAIIDKNTAQIIVYNSDGKALGRAPVLIGSAMGDDSAPGVGDRELSDIPMDERTTPAGRFLIGFGPGAGHSRVLWVDYVNSISIHAIPPTKASAKEKRTQRLASKTTDDNRITHGCINVSPAFYSKTVAPTFKKGGVFYVLPDTETLQEAIPAYGLNSVEAIAALEAADPVVPPDLDEQAASDAGGSQ